jgi:thiol-disulfide isomerase/thioredoxin
MRRSEDDAENSSLAPEADAKAPLLFQRQEEADETSTTPSFGQSVSIRSRPRTAQLTSSTLPAAAAAAETPLFQLGNVLVDDKKGSMINNKNGKAAAANTKNNDRSKARIAADNLLRRNKLVAVASITLAIASWTWQVFHPVTPIQLLADMERRSADISVVGKNGKPTLVDFWAPWCENCKLSAATMHVIETEYADRVNFIVVNGDDMARNGKLVEAFRVDAIPHLAFVEADGTVDTALIGPVPKRVLRADLDVLIENGNKKDATQREALPHQMLDVFENRPPEDRRVTF